MTPKEVLTLIREKEVKAIDLRFCDFPGTWQHFSIPPHHLEESTFQDGLGFDGSSIRGWQAINESDMLVIPVPETAFNHPPAPERGLAASLPEARNEARRSAARRLPQLLEGGLQ